MSALTPRALPVPSWMLAVTAMFSVQLGSALSVGLIDSVGPGGTAWLRLSLGAIVFVILARPPLRSIRLPDVPVLLGLGIATGVMTISFLMAIERIPLGTAVAIEFLGPLTVAAARSRSVKAMVWPALALLGVVLLTEPWQGSVDIVGIGFASIGGVCWGGYILLTQRAGDRFTGIQSLSITIPIAAVTAAIIGIPQAVGHLSVGIIAAAFGLALLLPVLPFALEMLALRRMAASAFGTLMAIEPALGLLIGLLVLGQLPSLIQIFGILLVVLAGAAAQRGSGRNHPRLPDPIAQTGLA